MKRWSRILAGLMTLAAMAVGGWYLLDLVKSGSGSESDLQLILRFQNAHGVTLGATIRHKGVRVGEVLAIEIPRDNSGVIVRVLIREQFKHTLRQSSRFWIVRPRFAGLAEGVWGLDTLIKDPYLEYDTPDLDLPGLVSGAVVFGLELRPAEEDSLKEFRQARRGARLSFNVRFALAQGLREGAPVLYRDFPVGTVLEVDLAPDGRAVEAQVSILERYASTVRTDSVFWVARPKVQFGFHWPNLINVNDLSKILTGTALSFATPTASIAGPIENGAVIDGASEPPQNDDAFQGPLVSIEPVEGEAFAPLDTPGLMTVEVIFAFKEDDLLRKREFLFHGTGLLFGSERGAPLVLTARTLADGAFSTSDLFGGPDILNPDLKVSFGDGEVYTAQSLWFDPQGRDLAVLALHENAPSPPKTRLALHGAGDPNDYFMLVAFCEGKPDKVRTQPIPGNKILTGEAGILQLSSELDLELDEWLGALLVDRGGKLRGIVGRREARSERPVVIALETWPVVEEGADIEPGEKIGEDGS